MRCVIVAAASVALAAAGPPVPPPPAPPPLPDAVSVRVAEGRFEPGQFEHLRGFFPEATPSQKAEYAAIVAWLERCEAEGERRMANELAALGVRPSGERINSAANLCQQVLRGDQFHQFASYAELDAATREARLVFGTLIETIRLAEQRIGPITPDFARELEARILGEQLLRLSFDWSYSPADNPRLPHMGEKARIVFDVLVMGELARTDFENTQWLKSRVAVNGWPTIGAVGEKAASAAWLLAQHADHDPAFQLQALRLMEPLLASKDVSPGNYAYLYDRITLKLTGKQRYATQFWCKDGKMEPRPLEAPVKIDELRAAMELQPLAEYAKFFRPAC